MRLCILVGLLSSVHCSNYEQNVLEDKERRIVGGGNFGGFIGLTTYGAGPFLVKGKFEKDIEEKKNSKNDDKDFNLNLNYENIQKDQPYSTGPLRYNKKRDEDEYLEYLGYRGDRECFREYKDEDEKQNINTRIQNQRNNSFNFFDAEVRDRCKKLFGFTGPTANDEPQNLVRPCALDDWQCIRKYFAANSNCKPVYGPIPDPLYIDVNTVFYPSVNITITLTNLMVRGLSNAKITEFYVNKKSGNLVLALLVTNLNETIPRAYFRYRRTAKESIVLADYATINYRSMTFTAVIPNVPHLRLDLADIHADVHDGTPPFFIGPGVANSADPDVVTAYSQFNLIVPIIAREALSFQSQLFTSIYIQKNICDFGLRVISV